MAHSLGSVLSYDVLCNQAAAAGAPGPESYLLTPPSPTTEIEECVGCSTRHRMQWVVCRLAEIFNRLSPSHDSGWAIQQQPTSHHHRLRKEVARLHALLSKQHQQGSDGAGTAVAVPALLFDVDCLILLGGRGGLSVFGLVGRATRALTEFPALRLLAPRSHVP